MILFLLLHKLILSITCVSRFTEIERIVILHITTHKTVFEGRSSLLF